MLSYWKNLRYIWKHKICVYKAGRKIGVSRLQLLTHDWSKLRPSEFIPYTHYFFENGKGKTEARNAFRLHYLRNPHHWQHWIITDTEGIHTIMMPDKYIREMVADWYGTGVSKTGFVDLQEWYDRNKDDILLHTITRVLVEEYIKEIYGG